MNQSRQRFPSLSHWGAFTAVAEGGRVVDCEPFARDPAPSPILRSMAGMVHSPLRIARPAVREGWLRQREGSDRAARGHDRFVEVDWDTALELVASQFGYDDWNILAARIAEAGEAKPEPVLLQPGIPVIRIFAIDMALEFYRDFLGFRLDWEYRHGPGFPVYMQVSRGALITSSP
mgnify:CR=1 FL=1